MDIKNLIESLGEKKEELIKKAAQCKSPEELLALAKENGIALDGKSAAELFTSMQPKTGKLSDDELDSVAGGQLKGWVIHCNDCGKANNMQEHCIFCGSYNVTIERI
jgi:predicted ribosomally synthesized peptide with nif11-like leader